MIDKTKKDYLLVKLRKGRPGAHFGSIFLEEATNPTQYVTTAERYVRECPFLEWHDEHYREGVDLFRYPLMRLKEEYR